MKIVIRAGGSGTRLWPMSRKNNPKQFQVIVGDKTLIRTTYERVVAIVKDPKNDIFVSINNRFEERTKKEIPEIPKKNIIIETEAMNTGPAICLEVCYLQKFCGRDEVIATLPADDYISNNKAFKDLLIATEKFIQKNPDYILTPAIKPYYVDTGYSYFKAGKNLQNIGKETIYDIVRIVEKPNYEYCKKLINSGAFYCHTGMYLWQLDHVAKLFKKHRPKMYKICQKVVELIFDKRNIKKAHELYGQLKKMTIETAITEKTKKIAMSVSNEIGWSDLGKWHVIKKIIKTKEGESLTKGKVLENDSKNNLIYSTVDKKIIAVNDLNNIVVIDTKDALFISSLEKSAEAKKIVEKLKDAGDEEYL